MKEPSHEENQFYKTDIQIYKYKKCFIKQINIKHQTQIPNANDFIYVYRQILCVCCLLSFALLPIIYIVHICIIYKYNHIVYIYNGGYCWENSSVILKRVCVRTSRSLENFLLFKCKGSDLYNIKKQLGCQPNYQCKGKRLYSLFNLYA